MRSSSATASDNCHSTIVVSNVSSVRASQRDSRRLATRRLPTHHVQRAHVSQDFAACILYNCIAQQEHFAQRVHEPAIELLL